MAKKSYTIDPPPKDKNLFRVVYSIDVPAANAQRAAEMAFKMMRSKESMAPILVVIDSKGRQSALDLAETLEFNRITTGFVCQKYRKNESGKFVCIHQEFMAGDEVQFENLKGDSIKAPEHDYQPFNMALLSRDEISDRLNEILASVDVSGEQSRQFAHEIGILQKLLKDLG
jgi:hypothetical protein